MTQPECGEYLEVQDVPLPSRSLLAGEWMWIAVFTAVFIFEIWAVFTGRDTMSEVLWRWPTWGKVLMAGFFAALMVHLFWHR